MYDEYGFSNGVENPYTRQKTTVTIRVDKETVDCFKNLSAEIKNSLPTADECISY